MSIHGISSNQLVSDLLEGKTQNVPVGQTVIYHDSSRNPANALPLSNGEDVTRLHINQFDAFGQDKQSLAAKRETETNDIIFSEREKINDGLLVEGGFDSTIGAVTLIKANKLLTHIDGFLTQSSYGRGMSGVRGNPGTDADDGYEGDDGDDGEEGCEGLEGSPGYEGPTGNQGPDGPRGIQGPDGAVGLVGVQGPVGPSGRYGHEGARGALGSPCLAELAAPAGATGSTPHDSAIISFTEPDSLTRIWAVPQ